MKNFKKLSILSSVILLAGIITFSACKKDDDDLNGTKAAQELCDCLTKAGSDEVKVDACSEALYSKYGSKTESEKFITDFMNELLKCDAVTVSDDLNGTEAAQEYCECLTEAGGDEAKIEACGEAIDSKYGSKVDDEKFEADFIAEILQCDAFTE